MRSPFRSLPSIFVQRVQFLKLYLNSTVMSTASLIDEVGTYVNTTNNRSRHAHLVFPLYRPDGPELGVYQLYVNRFNRVAEIVD